MKGCDSYPAAALPDDIPEAENVTHLPPGARLLLPATRRISSAAGGESPTEQQRGCTVGNDGSGAEDAPHGSTRGSEPAHSGEAAEYPPRLDPPSPAGSSPDMDGAVPSPAVSSTAGSMEYDFGDGDNGTGLAFVVCRPSYTADPGWSEKPEVTVEIDSGTTITEFTAPLEQAYGSQVHDLVLTGSCIRPGSPPGDSRKVTTTCAALLRTLQRALETGEQSLLIVQAADGTFVIEVSVAPRCAAAAMQATTAGPIEKRKPKPRGVNE